LNHTHLAARFQDRIVHETDAKATNERTLGEYMTGRQKGAA